MIKCLITFVSFMFACSLFAQEYNSINSLSRIGIVYYVEDENGFYNKMENVSLQSVRDPITTYAYDKKSQNLYMTTKRGNFVVRLNDAYANYFKRSKSVAFLKENELKEAIQSKNNELEEKYKKLNDERQKQIDASKERARIDSIKKAYNDSVKIVKEKERARIYRNNHDWSWVPTKGKRLFCVLCEKGITTRDSSLCYAIIKDSIYWADIIEGDLGVSYNHIHAAEVSKDLKKNISYAVHMEFYRDSLENIIPIMSKFYAGLKNYISYQDYLEKLKKKAPNGYFLGWNWDKEYSSISFNFRYLNTNKKTIKYIDVYWVLKNDVGDIRKSGHFSGTGPLGEWESASWDWDHSSYYVSGDASKMSLTKVIITYMDGSKVTIPKDKIWYN